MPLAVLRGGEAGDPLEVAGEGALVTVAAGEGDPGHRVPAAGEHGAGRVQAGLGDELHGREAEQGADAAAETVRREAGDGGEAFDAERLAVALADDPDRGGEAGEKLAFRRASAHVAGGAGQSDDPAVGGADRGLAGDAPALRAAGVETELEDVGGLG